MNKETLELVIAERSGGTCRLIEKDRSTNVGLLAFHSARLNDVDLCPAERILCPVSGLFWIPPSDRRLPLNSARENINTCHSPLWQSSFSFRLVIGLSSS
jgi:hypothetical protein